jgi:hypothetical protein
MGRLCRTFLAVLLVGGATTAHGQKSIVKMKRHDGATATYKHNFSTRFKSDRSHLLTTSSSQVAGQEGNIRNEDIIVDITGEWDSRETWRDRDEKSEGSGAWKVVSRLLNADSRATINGDKLGFEKYPFSFEQLANREFTFEVHPTDGPSLLRPGFRVYQLREREDIVTDLSLLWASGICPSFPDYAIGQGDSWESEQTLPFPFYALEATGKEATISVKSNYTVKKVRNGGKIFEIEEERRISYIGWTETASMSVMVEGSGKGKANWEIDADRGIVNKSEYQQFVEKPAIYVYGQSEQVDQVRAEYNMVYRMTLDKFKN